ncbi:integrase [Paenibacillus dendritiformis]|uniref:tyrosine-type recombinase/integrase n=1 Tax=Paenibacillus TaxID=44249 RepID=UPI001AFD128A|nr:tyrosine-type recombinase/integrase [Paenibacillus dendritiformis]GIO82883.1 integrase [Paenibacillus dendritiformis]
MASATKRGKTWQYCVSRMVNGKSKPIRKGGFSTKKEALIAAAEVEADLRKGIVPELKPRPFPEYFEEWLQLYKKNKHKNTFARYLNTLKTIQEHFNGIPIQNITKRQYQKFLNEYGEKRTKDTVRKLNTHIRACVREAIDEGLIRVDFTRGAVFSGGVSSKLPEEKHLSYFESMRLLRVLYSKDSKTLTHYLLLLALTSGMRFAELVGLTKDDFDFTTNKIRINKTWGYTKKMHTGFGLTKNPQSNRTIKMDKKTMSVFKELFETLPDNAYGLIFFSPTSKYKVLCNTGANKVLKNILSELNIDPITVHGLRHTHASVLLYKKVSINYVSERLGHENIDTTMKYYAHILKELRAEDEISTVSIFEKMAV